MIQKIKSLSKKKLIIITTIGVVVVGFFTWFLIKFFTLDTTIQVFSKYSFPESRAVSGERDIEARDYAIAVDGVTVTGKSLDAGELYTQPTASTAKMILGLAVMREKPFAETEVGEIITIDEEMYNRYLWYVNHGGSNTRVRVGEEISEYDALVSVFLASSNNMADSLAIWAFGSIDAYREYASSMLAEMGLTQTTIGEDACGFSDTTTSSASDLAILGEKVMRDPVLAKIVGTKSYEVPVAGLIENTNKILGDYGISGVKTGYIGDASGYCLISGYTEGEHVVTVSLLGAPTRAASFDESLELVKGAQDTITKTKLASVGQIIGYYDSWWTGPVNIKTASDFEELLWEEADKESDLKMDGADGKLEVKISNNTYSINVKADDYNPAPSFWERVMRVFGWEKGGEFKDSVQEDNGTSESEEAAVSSEDNPNEGSADASAEETFSPITNVSSDNCTIKYGYLMLINPNFVVDTSFIDARRSELVSVSNLYGIAEGNPYNGDNLLDAEAAAHLNEMVKAYEAEYPGHTFETRSCYRARGTTCGRLCAATGTSDHHTGLTCDLLDPQYGTSLDTDTYDTHIDWQWLYNNSYKYGFIDRFPYEWAGGPMSEPINVDENGSTGLFETWHYRYVGVGPATEIATGKYNNGAYDSIEHYLKARGLVTDLKNGKCK